jgi:hypothetical protein
VVKEEESGDSDTTEMSEADLEVYGTLRTCGDLKPLFSSFLDPDPDFSIKQK